MREDPPDRVVRWTENDRPREARWLSESRGRPGRVVVAGDELTADAAYRLATQGTAILWRGDYHNARQLLSALARRVDRGGDSHGRAPSDPGSPAQAFHRYRMAAAQRAHTLGMLLVELVPGGAIGLRRAPDTRRAVSEAVGPVEEPTVIALRELLGIIGAREWRDKGVHIPHLGDRIHPHYGVFAPIRQEYLDLVAMAPLPATSFAFDIGTGTGVLSALLARRGVARIVATDNDARAVACASDNIRRLGLAQRVQVVEADLFPPEPCEQRATLIVFNPPWIPARAATALEATVYDPGGRTLTRFLDRLPRHLSPSGEAWLILSDLAEHLGLRSRAHLLESFDRAGLAVLDRHDARPRHPRAADEDDPLHPFREAETTSLWRLTLASDDVQGTERV